MLEKYLKKGMRLALAVSGGKDSMGHAGQILRLKERFNLDVRVVNVNHKIRMNGGEDSRFVADYCKKRGVKCEVYEVDVPEYAAKKKLSLETAAREMRLRRAQLCGKKFRLRLSCPPHERQCRNRAHAHSAR